ncbi:circadian clock protein kinase KaiC [archaeon]|nr:circadian clock protein kinase KaiC [archaeon]
MDRAATGVRGLDDVLHGGFPFPSVVLIAGEPGVGKTTLCMQTLFEGARRGESGLYITAISEPVDQIHRYMAGYRFYDRSLVEEGLIKFLDISSLLLKEEHEGGGAKAALDFALDFIRKSGARRVVIDSITPFSFTFAEPRGYRRFLHELFIMLKAMETLTLLVAEFSPDETTNPENYMADGVVFLYLQKTEVVDIFKPAIQIRKMKGTEHTKDILRLGFTREGLRIL